MTIPYLEAVTFQRELPSGRTKPCIFSCESKNGDDAGEYVVKLKAGMDNGVKSLSAEMLGSLLADFFDMPSPKPAIINIDPTLAETIPNKRVRESAGENFGSKLVTGGYSTWPNDEAIPANLKTLAAEIFAFDALIQYPDRRVKKPNVLWKGDELLIIDHEMAFSFILDIMPQSEPWEISKLKFISEHLFYRQLKGQDLNFDRFAGALESMTEEKIKTITGTVPDSWQTEILTKIENHILEIVRHQDDFIDEIRRVLI